MEIDKKSFGIGLVVGLWIEFILLTIVYISS